MSLQDKLREFKLPGMLSFHKKIIISVLRNEDHYGEIFMLSYAGDEEYKWTSITSPLSGYYESSQLAQAILEAPNQDEIYVFENLYDFNVWLKENWFIGGEE